MMTPDQFETACKSLQGYWGVVGIFGGNPALNKWFPEICEIARRYFPKQQLGLWCNHPKGHGKVMRETFSPAASNLNVHLDKEAHNEFKRDWPESRPFGLREDSRHSPCYVAMRDVLKKKCECVDKIVTDWNDAWERGDMDKVAQLEAAAPVPCDKCNGTRKVYDEETAWELISNCDINQHWSALIGVFRNEVRGWFCEIAGAQAMLHQHDPEYPDTGIPIDENGLTIPCGNDRYQWWRMPMSAFAGQARKHCHECSVPLRGYGELAVTDPNGAEQVSLVHLDVFKPKKKDRKVQVVDDRSQLGKPLDRTTHYLQNSHK